MQQLLESTVETVWNNLTPELSEELIAYWLKEEALPTRELAEKRLEQVYAVARDGEQNLCGVCTVFLNFNRRLENSFYYFRTYVSAEHRRSKLGTKLILTTRDELNARYVSGDHRAAIGMIVEVQNAALKQHHTAAIWPATQFVYIGRNQRGDHVRVYYFDGAHIA